MAYLKIFKGTRDEYLIIEELQSLSSDLDMYCEIALDKLASPDAQAAYAKVLNLVEHLAHNAREAIIRKRYVRLKSNQENKR